jgi:hypothetical protein
VPTITLFVREMNKVHFTALTLGFTQRKAHRTSSILLYR